MSAHHLFNHLFAIVKATNFGHRTWYPPGWFFFQPRNSNATFSSELRYSGKQNLTAATTLTTNWDLHRLICHRCYVRMRRAQCLHELHLLTSFLWVTSPRIARSFSRTLVRYSLLLFVEEVDWVFQSEEPISLYCTLSRLPLPRREVPWVCFRPNIIIFNRQIAQYIHCRYLQTDAY